MFKFMRLLVFISIIIYLIYYVYSSLLGGLSVPQYLNTTNSWAVGEVYPVELEGIENINFVVVAEDITRFLIIESGDLDLLYCSEDKVESCVFTNINCPGTFEDYVNEPLIWSVKCLGVN